MILVGFPPLNLVFVSGSMGFFFSHSELKSDGTALMATGRKLGMLQLLSLKSLRSVTHLRQGRQRYNFSVFTFRMFDDFITKGPAKSTPTRVNRWQWLPNAG